jgi:hypothetical protein
MERSKNEENRKSFFVRPSSHRRFVALEIFAAVDEFH